MGWCRFPRLSTPALFISCAAAAAQSPEDSRRGECSPHANIVNVCVTVILYLLLVIADFFSFFAISGIQRFSFSSCLLFRVSHLVRAAVQRSRYRSGGHNENRCSREQRRPLREQRCVGFASLSGLRSSAACMRTSEKNCACACMIPRVVAFLLLPLFLPFFRAPPRFLFLPCAPSSPNTCAKYGLSKTRRTHSRRATYELRSPFAIVGALARRIATSIDVHTLFSLAFFAFFAPLRAGSVRFFLVLCRVARSACAAGGCVGASAAASAAVVVRRLK